MLFGDCIKYRDELYAFSLNTNLLIKLDLNNESATVIGSIPEESFDSRLLVSKMIVCNNKLLLVPCNATNIWIFNLDDRSWEKIQFISPELRYKFATAFIYKEKVYMIGCSFAAIVVYDFVKEELSYYYQPYEKWEKNKEIDIYCRDYVLIDNKKLLLPSCTSNEVAEVSLIDMNVKIHSIGDKKNRYESIAMVENECWLTPRVGDELVIWNMKDEYRIKNLKIGKKQNVCHYCGVIGIENKVYLYANDDATSYCFDINDKEYECNNEKYIFCHKDKEYSIVQNQNEELYILSVKDDRKIVTKDIEIKGLFSKDEKRLYHEDGNYTLQSFLDSVIND